MAFYFNLTFISKYLFGFTSEEEEVHLLENPEINGRMGEVWDNFSDIQCKENKPESDKIYQQIKTQANIPDKKIYSINHNEYYHISWFKNPAVLAITFFIIVLLGTSGFYLFRKINRNVYVEVVSEKGQRKEFTLPDGSRVWLNADTRIRHRKRFDKEIREVILSGEAYFSVVKDSSRPFVVKTSKLDIKVLGTVFNVKSYPGDKTIETTLVAGLVSIEKRSGKDKETAVLVKPRQKAVFNVSAEQIKVENVNVEKTTSWKNGKLVIDNESMESVLLKLQRWYGIRVELVGRNDREDRYTFTVKDENIEEVIHLLQLTSGLTFKTRDLNGNNERIYEPNTENHEIEK